jgi:hypothetical protein
MVIIVPVVVTPSLGVDVPVNVGVVDVSVNVGISAVDVTPVDVAAVDVTPVNVAAVNVTPVDVAPIDISSIDVGVTAAGRSVSDSRPSAAPASRDAGLGHAQPHATDKQNSENYDDPSHGFLLT